MNSKLILLVTFIAVNFCCSAQPDNKQFTLHQSRPLFVLKVDNKSVEIDSLDKFDPTTIDTSSIQEIQVLKGDDATLKFGAPGKNGVVIIYFKNYPALPNAIQDRFKK